MAVLWRVLVAIFSLLNASHVNRNKVNACRSTGECAPCSFENKRVDCTRRNLTKLPSGIFGLDAEILDLSDNKISELPNLAFANFSKLRGLYLEENKLKELPHNAFKGLKNLKVLNLKGNLFNTCPDFGQSLESLNELHLTGNKMAFIDENAFEHVSTVEHLWLDHNELTEVPRSALSKLKCLKYLSLDQNKIETIRNGSFNSLSELKTLLLFYNGVKEIEEEGFKGLTSLLSLNLRLNNLEIVPATLKDITNIEYLELDLNPITKIPDFAFKGLDQLQALSFTWDNLTEVGHSAFSSLPRLQKLTLVNVKLKKFPNLTGTSSLQYLTLTSNKIRQLPENLCENQKNLVDLNLNFNHITRIPDLSKCASLSVLKIEHNKIESIGSSLRGMKKLKDLTLKGNLIEEIPSRTFEGVSQLETLNLANNKIKHIDDDAFEPFKMIRVLDLSNNNVPKLPSRGLRTLQTVSVRENKELRDFPASKLQNIRHVDAHYPYHCCFFRREKEKSEKKDDQENVGGEPEASWTWHVESFLINNSSNYDMSGFGSGNVDPLLRDAEGSSGHEMMFPSSGSTYLNNIIHIEDEKDRQVKCTPEPADPFLPCDDLMDTSLLRFGVWVVFLLALLGNSTVIFVILTRRSRIDVPRFLICNLAVADLCLGIYLGLLAIVDASTRGNFRSYGVQWQLSHGCKTAGFLAVLSSETSVFTLTVLTVERYIAITHALDITKKMSLKKTAIIMLFGWCFAVVTATLPLVDVSDYTKFSVCLPFETGDIKSLTYVTTILILNGSAFLVILTCYLRIYCAIRGSNAWNTNDSRTAQRMALLVFTDFACWAPITFLSLAAAFGGTFVSLKDAKIFTVFVFPLNSCANPFLYAIFTAEFKRDCISFFRRVKTTHVAKLTSSRRRYSISTGEMRRNSQASSSNGIEGVLGKLRARDIRRNSLPPTIKMTLSKVSTRGETENEIVVERETVL